MMKMLISTLTSVETTIRFVWHQEYEDKIIPGSMGKAPIDANPWLVLTLQRTVDGEVYGRGRVEEFLGDLRSLGSTLLQALVEGSAAAAKVVFVLSLRQVRPNPRPSPQAGNGAIVQGRPDDISVCIQVGKTADFRTAIGDGCSSPGASA
jgi:hypothetical protein